MVAAFICAPLATESAVAVADPSTGIQLTCCANGSSFYDITPGVERPIAPIVPGDIVTVELDPQGLDDGWVYLHPCGTPPNRSQPAAAYARPGRMGGGTVLAELGRGFVVIGPGENCLTVFGNATSVNFWRYGRAGQPSGLNYVVRQVHTPALTPPFQGNQAVAHVKDGSAPADSVAAVVDVRMTSEVDPDSELTQVLIGECGQLGVGWLVAHGGSSDGKVAIVPLDQNGDICFELTGPAPAALEVDVLGYLSSSSPPSGDGLPTVGFMAERQPGYIAVTPRRLFDTRDAGVPLVGEREFRYRFGDLPRSATAVALNITATDTTAPGYVSAYPCGGSPPVVSNLNFQGPGQTVPNFAIVRLSAEQEVCFTSPSTTHLLADLSGYFAVDAGDGYSPAEPVRLFDTRSSSPVESGGVYVLQVPNDAPVGASAIVMNVTVTQTSGVGYISVYPCVDGRPTVSNLNYRPGESRPNLVTVRVPPDGRICFYTLAATHLLADLTGYYEPTSDVGLIAFDPHRVFDSRDSNGPPFNGGQRYSQLINGFGVVAVAWNVTVTQPTAAGFVTVAPCKLNFDDTSTLNYAPGQTVANFAIVQLSSPKVICLETLRTAHLIADEAGIFTTPIWATVPYDD